MKPLKNGFLIMLGMFTRIPVRTPEWSEENLRYSLPLLPAAGVLAGILSLLWLAAAEAVRLPLPARGAGLVFIPLLLTGGIHLDGYADTADAVACWGDAEKRRRVLKDPHIGAFAAIRTGAFLIGWYALCLSLIERLTGPFPAACVLGGIFCLGRAFSALALIHAKQSAQPGLGAEFSRPSGGSGPLILLLFWCAVGAALLSPAGVAAAAVIACGATACLFCLRRADRLFGCFSGDLAGHAICVTEISMLFGLVVSLSILMKGTV